MRILGIVVGVLLVMAVFVILISIYENRHFKVVEYRIRAPHMFDKPEGLKLAVISDLHDQQYGAHNQKLLAAIHDQHPDMILAAGDLTVGRPHADNTVALQLVTDLQAEYPVYLAMGNHEYRMKIYPEKYGSMWKDYESATKASGAKWLDNESVYITWDTKQGLQCRDTSYDESEGQIVFTGFSMDACYYKRFRQTPMPSGYVQSCCGEKPAQSYQILLAHNPDYFENYVQYGADLVISGHVHGGMIRIPGIGGFISPMFRLFPKYDKGIYEMNHTKMLVSAGLGNHTFKFRVNNRPELIMLTITK